MHGLEVLAQQAGDPPQALLVVGAKGTAGARGSAGDRHRRKSYVREPLSAGGGGGAA